MKRQLLISGVILLLHSCSSNVPVTFNGKKFNGYLNEDNNLSKADYSLHRKWKLISLNGDIAPYGILLDDLNLWLHFRQKAGKTSYKYVGHGVPSSFWGAYEFDQDGGITILSMGDDRVLRVVSEDHRRIESKFRTLIRDAKAYEIAGSEMKLHSAKEYLEFYAVD